MVAPEARLRSNSRTFLGLPMVNVVLLELGIGIGLLLLAVDSSLIYVAIGVAAVGALLALLRVGGQWFTSWLALNLSFRARSREKTTEPVAQRGVEELGDEQEVTGADDPRVNLLRLFSSDLVVAHGTDHDRNAVGLAWNDGSWTAVLLVEPTPALISQAGDSTTLPLSVLAPCLEDRGVLLDAIKVIWHCYPGSAALPANSPALNSYMEVLGPLPAAARRTTWIAVRLDPRRCPAAIRERGGGVVGAHRALIGALSRVRNALDSENIPTRPLNPDELLRAGVASAELTAAVSANAPVAMQERWNGVTAGGIGHASYAVTGWPKGKVTHTLNALTSARALSSTVALSIEPAAEEGQIGLRGVVRVSARNPQELDTADQQLAKLAGAVGVELTPLHGKQLEGLAATLPSGGAE